MHDSITKTTADRIKSFIRPGVETGIIPRDEYQVVAGALRNLSGAPRPSTPPTTAALLTLAQAADRLSCSKRTVSRMIRAGRLPAVHLTPGAHKSLRVREVDIASLCIG